jgi:hypothetical protein
VSATGREADDRISRFSSPESAVAGSEDQGRRFRGAGQKRSGDASGPHVAVCRGERSCRSNLQLRPVWVGVRPGVRVHLPVTVLDSWWVVVSAVGPLAWRGVVRRPRPRPEVRCLVETRGRTHACGLRRIHLAGALGCPRLERAPYACRYGGSVAVSGYRAPPLLPQWPCATRRVSSSPIDGLSYERWYRHASHGRWQSSLPPLIWNHSGTKGKGNEPAR